MKRIRMRVTAEMFIYLDVDDDSAVGKVTPTKEDIADTWDLLREVLEDDGTLLRVKHGEAEVFTVN